MQTARNAPSRSGGCVARAAWTSIISRRCGLSGPDAATFLQGYLTCDMTALEPTRALWGAYCNIKGRVVADATVVLE